MSAGPAPALLAGPSHRFCKRDRLPVRNKETEQMHREGRLVVFQ